MILERKQGLRDRLYTQTHTHTHVHTHTYTHTHTHNRGQKFFRMIMTQSMYIALNIQLEVWTNQHHGVAKQTGDGV